MCVRGPTHPATSMCSPALLTCLVFVYERVAGAADVEGNSDAADVDGFGRVGKRGEGQVGCSRVTEQGDPAEGTRCRMMITQMYI